MVDFPRSQRKMKNKPKYTPHIHHRKSIRLKGYDYAQAGLYFITICCQDRACLFGNVVNGKMVLNDKGFISNQCWLQIPNHFPNAVLHEYIIMPNHVHGIIEIKYDSVVGAENFPPYWSNDFPPYWSNDFPPRNENNMNNDIWSNDFPPHNKNTVNNDNWENDYSPPQRSPSKTIGSIVRGFKIGVTKWMRQNTEIYDVWQRNYYEHIIRNEQSYHNISEYIINNPAKWAEDKFYQK